MHYAECFHAVQRLAMKAMRSRYNLQRRHKVVAGEPVHGVGLPGVLRHAPGVGGHRRLHRFLRLQESVHRRVPDGRPPTERLPRGALDLGQLHVGHYSARHGLRGVPSRHPVCRHMRLLLLRRSSHGLLLYAHLPSPAAYQRLRGEYTPLLPACLPRVFRTLNSSCFQTSALYE